MAQAEEGSDPARSPLSPASQSLSGLGFREGKSRRAGIKQSQLRNDEVAHLWRSRVCGGREREQALKTSAEQSKPPSKEQPPTAGEQRRPRALGRGDVPSEGLRPGTAWARGPWGPARLLSGGSLYLSSLKMPRGKAFGRALRATLLLFSSVERDGEKRSPIRRAAPSEPWRGRRVREARGWNCRSGWAWLPRHSRVASPLVTFRSTVCCTERWAPPPGDPAPELSSLRPHPRSAWRLGDWGRADTEGVRSHMGH